MPLNITFKLSDEDLQRFQDIVDKARSAMKDETSLARVEQSAIKMIKEAEEADLPTFISERLLKLQILLDMVRDEEWQLSENERKQILSALAYFCDPEDVIPDHIPGIGFLDDAIYTEIIIQELHEEIDAYDEFSRFRSAEEARRKKSGLDVRVGRDDWLADKRAALHSRRRKRRQERAASQTWRVKLF